MILRATRQFFLALLLPVSLWGISAAGQTSIPNTILFERRGPNSFVARAGGGVSYSLTPADVRIRMPGGEIVMRFEGGSPDLEPVGISSTTTYLHGASRRRYASFPEVSEKHLYRGIDALFHASGREVEYDLTLAPHASIQAVHLSFKGASGVRVDAAGDLLLETAGGVLRQKRPVVAQKGKAIDAWYEIGPDHRVSFRVGRYDHKQALTIDPVVVYERVFGGSGSDVPTSIATDLQGNVIIAGVTTSEDFPTTSNSYKPSFPGPLLISRDGGTSFASVSFGIATNINAIAFSKDGLTGYVDTSGDPLSASTGVYRTVDSGKTWTIVKGHLPYSSSMLVLGPSSPSDVFSVTPLGVYKSNDAGDTWTKLPISPAGQGEGNPHFLAVSQSDPQELFVIKGYLPAYAFRSRDGGATWSQLTLPQYYSPLSIAIDPTDPNVVYTAGSFQNLFKSVDGGDHWFNPTNLYTQNFNGATLTFDPADSSILYAANAAGIQKSTDRGANFLLLPAPRYLGTGLFQIDPTNSTHFVTVGNTTPNPEIYQSYNAGLTWTAVGSFPFINSIAVNGRSLYVASQSGQEVFVMKWNPAQGRVLWSTYLGGVSAGGAVVTDRMGDVYIAGTTISREFPTTPKAYQVSPGPNLNTVGFVSKLSSDGGQLLWSTFLGGGFCATPYETGTDILTLQVDAAGSAFVAGQSAAPDFPAHPLGAVLIPPSSPTSGACSVVQPPRAFIAKLDPAGSALLYSTFLPGVSAVTALALDSSGSAYIGGSATPAFPVTPDALQTQTGSAFFARVAPDGSSLTYSSFLGKNTGTTVSAIATTPSGNVLITGSTNGIPINALEAGFQAYINPTACPHQGGGDQDAFVLSLNPALRLSLLSYLGGSCYDGGSAIGTDPAGNIWLSGFTTSRDFPLRFPYQGVGTGRGFIAELSPDASRLLFSSYVDQPPYLALFYGYSVFLASSTGRFGGLVKQFDSSSAGGAALFTRIDPSPAPPVELDAVSPYDLHTVVAAAQLAPGSLVHLEGVNLAASSAISSAGVSVLFNGIPAQILSAQPNRIIGIVPVGIAGQNEAHVQVVNNELASNSVRVLLTTQSIGVLSILDQDGASNSMGHPARPGETITVIGTGFGPGEPANLFSIVFFQADGSNRTPASVISLDPLPLFGGASVGVKIAVPSQVSPNGVWLMEFYRTGSYGPTVPVYVAR